MNLTGPLRDLITPTLRNDLNQTSARAIIIIPVHSVCSRANGGAKRAKIAAQRNASEEAERREGFHRALLESHYSAH